MGERGHKCEMKLEPESAVKTYSADMLRAAYTILGSKEDSEDAVQEAFLKLLLKNPAFRDSEHAKAWLLRVTINISKSMLRYRSSHYGGEAGESTAADISVESEDDYVLKAVMALPDDYRAVIFLYYYEEYSVSEIAEILKRPVSTVTTRLARARQSLRKVLEGEMLK